MFTIFNNMLEKFGETVTVERGGNVISSLKGVRSQDKSPHKITFHFPPDNDIKSGDWIVSERKERYFVVDTHDMRVNGKVETLDCTCITQSQFDQQHATSSAVTFNIGSADGSIIGTQSVATLNYSGYIDDMRRICESGDNQDSEELKQLTELLKMMLDEKVSAKKGLFSKFSEVIKRNSEVTEKIAFAIISWLTSSGS